MSYGRGHEKGTRQVTKPTPHFDAIQAEWLARLEREAQAQHQAAAKVKAA
jgi:hypothetical protein